MTRWLLYVCTVSVGMTLGCAGGETAAPAPVKQEQLPPMKVGQTFRSPSGLEFTHLRDGFGDRPGPRSKVRVHYHGTLKDGTVFDSSVDRGQAATFGLNQVIRCWTEGIQRMQSGSKARLVCPAKIAYGEKGRPPIIPPNTTLIFDVELLDVL